MRHDGYFMQSATFQTYFPVGSVFPARLPRAMGTIPKGTTVWAEPGPLGYIHVKPDEVHDAK